MSWWQKLNSFNIVLSKRNCWKIEQQLKEKKKVDFQSIERLMRLNLINVKTELNGYFVLFQGTVDFISIEPPFLESKT